MARSRRSSNTARVATRSEDLSKLSSEVLKLRLQSLNLPITGSKVQLLARLKRASTGKGSQSKRRPGRPQRTRHTANKTSTQQPSTTASEIDATQGRRLSIPEDSALSDRASLSSIEDMLQSDTEEDLFHTNHSTDQRDALSPAQRSAIEDIVSRSVHSALDAVRTNSAFSPTPSSQTLAASGMASPLGLSRPVDRNMEDKILRGEYVDLALLLPDNLYQSQAPEIQLRLDDSSSGPLGSPVTMVRKRKPVIDSFQKWLEAYMVYMLVIVTAYPRRALELIKYQQIISRAVTKFKGLAWLSYDQQFRRRASSNLSLQWDKVDLELWTVTFSGLAKPHCGICSSPYHAEDVCPSADPYRKQRRSQTVCFDFNKSSGCRRRNCSYPHVCRRCYSNGHTVQDCPQQQSSGQARNAGVPRPSERSKK